MKKPHCLILLLCLAFLFSGWCCAENPAAWKTAVQIDVQKPEEARKWGRFEVYDIPESDVSGYKGDRKIFFGKTVEFDFEGLPEGKDCKVTATFLADTDRVLALDGNGTEFESNLVVKKGTPVTESWVIPSSRLYSGRLSVTISAISGPNAVLQKLEVQTADGKALRPGSRKQFKEASSEELEKLVIPMPKTTPRPVAVGGVKKALLSLNGTWEFAANGVDGFKPIQVPGEWKMQGFDVPAKGFALYRRSFSVPADWKGSQVKLRFDSVHAVCEVFINGKEVAKHEGGFVPFELDVTRFVKPGSDNQLEVRVQSESTADSVSCISQYAAHQVGGILRKVTLFAVPDVYVASEKNSTTLDPTFKDAVWHYTADVQNSTEGERKVELSVTLDDALGKSVGSQTKTLTLGGGKSEEVSFEIPVKSAKLWNSETPVLYTAKTSLSAAGKELSKSTLKVGLRQVETKGNLFLVNGMPVKLLAANRHEVHPLRGRSLTEDLCREDARLYKAANANTIRTSHYPPSEEFLEACDEIGLFVESEAAVCWIEHHASPVWRRWNYLNPEYLIYFLRPNLEHISAYRNHPSIIFWSMANESRWSSLWAKVLDVVKRYEQSRPIAFHDQCWGGFNNAKNKADVANYHYPSEGKSETWSQEGRPVWFGEYAHLQCYNRRELATDPGIQEDWSRPLQRMVDLMWEQPGCLGGSIWSGIDDVFHLPDGNLCGYGHWGPIDGWRREKPEYHGMRMAYTPFRVFSVQAEEGKPLVLSVQNRQNFLNLKDNDISWKTKSKSGKIKSDLAPHAKGDLRIEESFKAGEVVTVTVKDPKGVEIAREVVTIPGGKTSETAKSGKKLPLTVSAENDTLVMEKAGQKIALPVPMVLPLNGEGGAAGPAGSTLSNKIEPFTPVSAWTWSRSSAQGADIQFTGKGEDGEGSLVLTPQADGRLHVKYSVTVNKDINPRQWGVVFELPGEFDTLAWDRKSHWSWYPEDQIGRPVGKVKANPVVREFVEEPGIKPDNAWKDNSNALGTNDFRSTKMNIGKASLVNPKGYAFTIAPVEGQPRPAVRAWVNDKKVRVLVAGFNTGGSDGFFGTHYSAERKPLKKGDVVSAEFIIGQEKSGK